MPEADYRLMTEATGQRIAAALESLVNLGDPVTIAHGGTGARTAAAALAALGGVAVTDIVDNLTNPSSNTIPSTAAVANMLLTRTVTVQNVTIPANSYKEVVVDIGYSGYTTIAVLSIFGASTAVFVLGNQTIINNGQSRIILWNLFGQDRTSDVDFNVLYRKS